MPQACHRYVLFGLRGDLGLEFKVPKPSMTKKSCREAIDNPPIASDCPNNELTKQSAKVVERLKLIRPGENVWDVEDRLPPELRLNVRRAMLSQAY